MGEGLGNIVYDTPSSLGTGGAAIANNGLSVFGGTTIQLYGPAGAAAPAQLLNNRELPMNGFSLLYSGMNNAANWIWQDDTNAPQNYIKILGKNLAGNENFRFAYSTDVPGDNGGIFIGLGTGAALTGVGLNNNHFFGFRVAQIMTTGTGNCHFGYESFTHATTAGLNSGFGNSVMNGLTSGSENAGFGNASFQQITTGSRNTGCGRNPGTGVTGASSDNVFIGRATGNYLGTGGGIAVNQETHVGSSIFTLGISSAGANVLIGYNICNVGTNIIGSNNQFIGANITATGTPSNTTLLGQGMSTTISNVAGIGRQDQNVIIGATAVTTDNGPKLQVLGAFGVPIRTTAVSTTFVVGSSTGNGDHTIILTASPIVITIPAASAANKGAIAVLANNAAANTTNITFINRTGAASNNLGANTDTWLQSDGSTNWFEIS
jgi:hypothetical protein